MKMLVSLLTDFPLIRAINVSSRDFCFDDEKRACTLARELDKALVWVLESVSLRSLDKASQRRTVPANDCLILLRM